LTNACMRMDVRQKERLLDIKLAAGPGTSVNG